MVYGITLRLPGEFFHTQRHTTQSPDPVNSSEDHDAETPATFSLQTSVRTSHVHSDLTACSYVFMRHDTMKKPLQPPFDGPYLVLNQTNKHFTLDFAGKKKVVLSTDWIQPTWTPPNLLLMITLSPRTLHLPIPPQLLKISHQHLQFPRPPQPRVARSGRHVHWPRKLAEYCSLP